MPPKGKQYEIEHIWADKFEEHKDEFQQKNEFEEWRNSIGALLLLPSGTNQSYGSDNYETKLEHYIKENTFAASLNEMFYEKNPNARELTEKFDFKPHTKFKKEDISERKNLLKRICEDIWNVNHFE